ncbi:serine/threonine-protein kinase PDIK1L-like [Ptychodera flava]|uniref:serine/threonine-protein kinase PDIK1L-like n=1 Tax=Ptychodera flava TaxID=63121 RepID=UPI003969CCFE
MAPEVFEGCHTEKVDVFSLGVIFCAILERLVLNIPGRGLELVIIYDNDIQFPIGLVLQQNPHAVRLVLPMITVPGETTSLVEAMLYADNISRPSAEEVYKSLKLKSTTRCPNCSVL